MKKVPADRIFNKPPMEIAKIIKWTRVKSDLTQKTAAARCGVKRATIGALEEGRISNVSDGKIWKICEGLGIDTNDLRKISFEEIKPPFIANWVKEEFFQER